MENSRPVYLVKSFSLSSAQSSTTDVGCPEFRSEHENTASQAAPVQCAVSTAADACVNPSEVSSVGSASSRDALSEEVTNAADAAGEVQDLDGNSGFFARVLRKITSSDGAEVTILPLNTDSSSAASPQNVVTVRVSPDLSEALNARSGRSSTSPSVFALSALHEANQKDTSEDIMDIAQSGFPRPSVSGARGFRPPLSSDPKLAGVYRAKKMLAEMVSGKEPIGLNRFNNLVMSRNKLVDWMFHPLFEQTVRGCFVKANLSRKKNDPPLYRIGEIVAAKQSPKVYEIVSTPRSRSDCFSNIVICARFVDHFGVGHLRELPLTIASNRPVEWDEFEIWHNRLRRSDSSVLTHRYYEQKRGDLERIATFRMTNEDTAKVVEKRKRLESRFRHVETRKPSPTKHSAERRNSGGGDLEHGVKTHTPGTKAVRDQSCGPVTVTKELTPGDVAAQKPVCKKSTRDTSGRFSKGQDRLPIGRKEDPRTAPTQGKPSNALAKQKKSQGSVLETSADKRSNVICLPDLPLEPDGIQKSTSSRTQRGHVLPRPVDKKACKVRDSLSDTALRTVMASSKDRKDKYPYLYQLEQNYLRISEEYGKLTTSYEDGEDSDDEENERMCDVIQQLHQEKHAAREGIIKYCEHCDMTSDVLDEEDIKKYRWEGSDSAILNKLVTKQINSRMKPGLQECQIMVEKASKEEAWAYSHVELLDLAEQLTFEIHKAVDEIRKLPSQSLLSRLLSQLDREGRQVSPSIEAWLESTAINRWDTCKPVAADSEEDKDVQRLAHCNGKKRFDDIYGGGSGPRPQLIKSATDGRNDKYSRLRGALPISSAPSEVQPECFRPAVSHSPVKRPRRVVLEAPAARPVMKFPIKRREREASPGPDEVASKLSARVGSKAAYSSHRSKSAGEDGETTDQYPRGGEMPEKRKRGSSDEGDEEVLCLFSELRSSAKIRFLKINVRVPVIGIRKARDIIQIKRART